MKALPAVMLLLLLGKISSAQISCNIIDPVSEPKRIIVCTPGRGHVLQNKPLSVIYSRGRIVYKSDNYTRLDSISPLNLIQNIKIIKGIAATDKYGQPGRFGVVEIYIDPKKDRKSYRSFRRKTLARDAPGNYSPR